MKITLAVKKIEAYENGGMWPYQIDLDYQNGKSVVCVSDPQDFINRAKERYEISSKNAKKLLGETVTCAETRIPHLAMSGTERSMLNVWCSNARKILKINANTGLIPIRKRFPIVYWLRWAGSVSASFLVYFASIKRDMIGSHVYYSIVVFVCCILMIYLSKGECKENITFRESRKYFNAMFWDTVFVILFLNIILIIMLLFPVPG